MLPFAKGLAQCPPSPLLAIPSRQPHGVVSGATEGKREGRVLTHNLTLRSNPCQRVPHGFPKFPEALASLDTATTGTPLCHFPRHWHKDKLAGAAQSWALLTHAVIFVDPFGICQTLNVPVSSWELTGKEEARAVSPQPSCSMAPRVRWRAVVPLSAGPTLGGYPSGDSGLVCSVSWLLLNLSLGPWRRFCLFFVMMKCF